MKRFILTSVVVLLAVAGAAAQEKFEVRAGIAGYPLAGKIEFGTWGHDFTYHPASMGDIYKDYQGPMYSTGLINLEFDYHVNKWLSMCCNLYTEGLWAEHMDGINDQVTGTDRGVVFTVLPYARFTYLTREWVRLYSGAGVGFVAGTMAGESEFYITPHLIPFGLSVGRKFFGYLETGLGAAFCGINAGIGYRF